MIRKHYEVVAVPSSSFCHNATHANNKLKHDDDDNQSNQHNNHRYVNNQSNNNDNNHYVNNQPCRTSTISTEDFRNVIEAKCRQYFVIDSKGEKNDGKRDSCSYQIITVDQVTRLVNEEDLIDYFVVGLLFDPSAFLEENQPKKEDDLQTIYGLFENVTDWLDTTAEIWVDGTEALPFAPPYGWKVQDFVCSWNLSGESINPDSVCHLLKTYGLVVIQSRNGGEDLIYPQNEQQESTSKMLLRAKRLLQGHVSLLEETVRKHHSHIKLGESAFGFEEFTHRGPQRFEVLLDQGHSELYNMLREKMEPQWIESICQYLGTTDRNTIRLNISCVYSRPGAPDQDWHTDGSHYTDPNISSKNYSPTPYAVCIFIPLIPLTQETGYTRFWPKSLLYPNLLGLAQAADNCLQASVDVFPLHPGDYIMYDYTTWHKGMANTSQNTERPIIQFLYSCIWYKERKNYGTRSVFDVHR